MSLDAKTPAGPLAEKWGRHRFESKLVNPANRRKYTIIIVGLSHAANLSLYAKLGYDPVKDFTAVTQAVAIDTFLVTHPSIPARTVKDLVALARAQPGTLNYGSGGNGSSPHMAMELFKMQASIDMTVRSV